MMLRSTLASGAALCAATLQSAAHAQMPPMVNTTVTGFATTMSGPGPETTLSYTFTGSPTMGMAIGSTPLGAGGFGAIAGNTGSGDLMYTELVIGTNGTPGSTTVQSATISWTVTFSTSMQFMMFYELTPFTGTWTHNSSVLSVGDIFAAGSHTFLWTLDAPQAANFGDRATMGLVFAPGGGGGGGVPLPGAAGLAAAGLAGLSRRRRR